MSIITQRIEEWARDHAILPDMQQGFRRSHRTENAPFILLTLLEQAKASRSQLFVALVDLAKAFDSVPRQPLWQKMANMGAHGPIFDLLREIYASVTSTVKTHSDVSDAFRIIAGVLQGDPASGLLWNLYVSDVSVSPSEAPLLEGLLITSLMMADDIALVATSMGGIADRLASLQNYCRINRLTISASKSVVLAFDYTTSARLARASLPTSLNVNGMCFPLVPSAKYWHPARHASISEPRRSRPSTRWTCSPHGCPPSTPA